MSQKPLEKATTSETTKRIEIAVNARFWTKTKRMSRTRARICTSKGS
jgi:hypothetical protein